MLELNDHSSRAHALLSASSSHRWLKCPPSAVAAELYPETQTEFTREGTLAHEIAEAVARHVLEGSADLAIIDAPGADREMQDCARGYAEYISERLRSDDAEVLLEQRVDFSPWVPEGFGTCDCIVIQDDTLEIIDYKYGKGVAVSAVGNPQLRLYALGALNDYGLAYDVKRVIMHIYQPRLNNISSDQMSVGDLMLWGASVKPTAALAATGAGDFCAGTHCRFCPHAGACPTLANFCTTAVQVDGGAAAVPMLPPFRLAELLELEPVVTAWMKAVKDRALATLMDGVELPGWKLVEGRPGNRKWTDEVQVAQRLEAAGYAADVYTETKLRSPAALDKALGKKAAAELLSGLSDRSPGAPTVVPASDKRPAYDRRAEALRDFE